MNTRALFPLLFTVASFSASAGNWAVKNGWCQTMTEDGQALVMLKNGTIGITGLMQGCPNGVQTLLGSRISINGNLIPTSQMCNQQTVSENSRYVGLPPCFIARRPFLTRTGGCRHNSLPQCAY